MIKEDSKIKMIRKLKWVTKSDLTVKYKLFNQKDPIFNTHRKITTCKDHVKFRLSKQS